MAGRGRQTKELRVISGYQMQGETAKKMHGPPLAAQYPGLHAVDHRATVILGPLSGGVTT